jgi:MSHA biogenesis protein MshK
MAQSLISGSSQMTIVRAIFVLMCTMYSLTVMAQTLADPTRPPATVSDASTNAEILAGPVLQSILIAPNRRLAIINGQTVALNGKYGEQTLIKMTETEVVLRNGKEFQTLKLFPDFNKKLIGASGK